jgi:hypothetical protein
MCMCAALVCYTEPPLAALDRHCTTSIIDDVIHIVWLVFVFSSLIHSIETNNETRSLTQLEVSEALE